MDEDSCCKYVAVVKTLVPFEMEIDRFATSSDSTKGDSAKGDYPPSDGIWNRLTRESEVIFGGTVDAASSVISNYPETLLTLSTSFAIGSGIRIAEARFPGLKPTAAVLMAASTGSWLKDMSGKVGQAGRAIADAWDPETDLSKSRRQFADSAGKLTVDLLLTSSAGLVGSGATNKVFFGSPSDFVRIRSLSPVDSASHRMFGPTPHDRLFRKDSLEAKIFSSALPALARVETTIYNAEGKPIAGSRANAFFVSEDGMLATNFHVVEGKGSFRVIDHKGNSSEANVLAVDETNDLAVLQVERKVGSEPYQFLPLAKDPSVSPGEPIFSVGHIAGWEPPTLARGQVRQTMQVPTEISMEDPFPAGFELGKPILNLKTGQISFDPPLPAGAEVTLSTRPYSSFYANHGFSGSPVFTEKGLVGVTVGFVPRSLLQSDKLLASSASVSDLSRLLANLG